MIGQLGHLTQIHVHIIHNDAENAIFYTQHICEIMARLDTALEMSPRNCVVNKSNGEDFQDLRVYTTDVEYLKKTHVHKEVFLVEIKRLDEKINRGLEALNTRIEDLKAIKFWSKRTLLEIALAVWGAIVTLYATGILTF